MFSKKKNSNISHIFQLLHMFRQKSTFLIYANRVNKRRESRLWMKWEGVIIPPLMERVELPLAFRDLRHEMEWPSGLPDRLSLLPAREVNPSQVTELAILSVCLSGNRGPDCYSHFPRSARQQWWGFHCWKWKQNNNINMFTINICTQTKTNNCYQPYANKVRTLRLIMY